MRIVILGAGQVGGSLAQSLADENNDITVVDLNEHRLSELRDSLDIKTEIGMASMPHVLRRAGVDDADMLIAVTNSDETNMVACQIAHVLFNTPKKISRIRSTAFSNEQALFDENAFHIDVIISPETLVTKQISYLLEYPGALQVMDFADNKVQLVAVEANYGDLMVGQAIVDLKEHLPNIDARIAAIFRRGKAINPRKEVIIEAGDEVFFIAARNKIKEVMAIMRRVENRYKRIIIAGGGNIGYRMAKTLESDYPGLKLIEKNPARAEYLSENLNRTVVLLGSATDSKLLEEENIANTDVFCVVTDDDEVNIMSSLLAKRLGVRKVITLINKSDYVDLVQGDRIDVGISPQQTTISALLTHIRKGDVAKVHSLRRGAAEAIETIAHGDAKTSKVIGRRIDELDLPPNTIIGAVVRGDDVLIGLPDLVIEADDHAIIFVMDKNNISKIEKLFQVGIGFF